MKFALPFIYVVYIFILIAVPAIRVYRQTGINPIRTKNERSVHAYITSLVRVLFLLPFVSVLLYSSGGIAYLYLGPVVFMQAPAFDIAGWIILAVALVWIAIAQYQMGASWRVGIDDENRTALVSKGLYRISRNPIYLGIVAMLIGFFLVLPDMLTFATMLAAFFMINVQIRLEEDFLLQQHGESFRTYLSAVRRWI